MAYKHEIQYISFYTHGSAAQKITPAVCVREDTKVARRAPVKRKVIYIDPVAIVSICVAVCLMVFMAVSFFRLQEAKQELAVMEQYMELVQQERETLSQQYRDGIDLEMVERTALALGMVPKEQANTQILQIPQQAAQTQDTELSVWNQLLSFLTGILA